MIFFKKILLIVILTSVPVFSEKKSVRYSKLLVGGDVMFNWGIQETKAKKGRNAPIIQLKNLFGEADFRAINLETPVTKKALSDYEKPYVFNSSEDDLLSLRDIGVDLVFLGNNHTMDYGETGLKETLENLTDMNLLYVGAGMNLVEALSPVKTEINGNFFQFYSVSEIGESRLFAKEKKGGIAPLKKNLFSKNKPENAAKILSIHWGEEYRPTPYSSQVSTARSLIDSGFKVIVGHHPHVPQAIEKYKNGIIFYSLGNLIFGSRNSYLNHNLVSILHFENGELTLCEIIPVFGKFQNRDNDDHIVRPLNRDESTEFLREISILCDKRNTRMKIINGRGYIYFRKD